MEFSKQVGDFVDGVLKNTLVSLQKVAKERGVNLTDASPDELVKMISTITGVVAVPSAVIQQKYPAVAGKTASVPTGAAAGAAPPTGTCSYIFTRGASKGHYCPKAAGPDGKCTTHKGKAGAAEGKSATPVAQVAPHQTISGSAAAPFAAPFPITQGVSGLGSLSSIPAPIPVSISRSIPAPVPHMPFNPPVKNLPAGWLHPDHSGISKDGVIFIVRKDTGYQFPADFPTPIPAAHIYFPVIKERNGELVPLTFEDTAKEIPGISREVFDAGTIKEDEAFKAQFDFVCKAFAEYKRTHPMGVPPTSSFVSPLGAGATFIQGTH